MSDYNFAYLDEQTKRMIRRAILKGLATNAVSIRTFFERTAGVATTTNTSEASVIQTRHRIPEEPLSEGQILVYQVPIPEPLRFLEPRESETRKMHSLEEYGLMHVKL